MGPLRFVIDFTEARNCIRNNTPNTQLILRSEVQLEARTPPPPNQKKNAGKVTWARLEYFPGAEGRTRQSTVSNETPPLVEGGDPVSKHISGLGTNRILVMDPTGPETNNDCAGEGQQQITALLSRLERLLVYITFARSSSLQRYV
jgi:hypothetical protein